MTRRRLAPLLFLLVAGALLWWWFLPTNVLKRRVGNLLDSAEVPATMSDLARGTRGPSVASYLARKVRIHRPEDLESEIASSMDRDRISGLYSAAAKYCVRISFEEPEFDEVSVEGDQATVRFRVDAIAEFPTRRPADGIQVVETTWEKTDGDWLLRTVSWEETTRR